MDDTYAQYVAKTLAAQAEEIRKLQAAVRSLSAALRRLEQGK